MINILRTLRMSVLIGIFLLSCEGTENSELVDLEFDANVLTKLKAEADAETVMKAVADKKGSVVLLNMWATWCEPCVEEFPDIIMLHNKYKDKGLEVITVSFDFVPSVADSFLAAQKTNFTNYLKSQEQDEHYFIIGIDEDWYGALPATWLFDRNGERRYLVQDRFETEELEKKIVELLEK